MDKRKPVGCLFVLIVGIAAVAYIIYLWLQLGAAEERAALSEAQLQEIAALQPSEAYQANSDFLSKFFTYNSTKERYEGIQPLMTEAGYRSTFPSGDKLPESDQTVKSTLADIKAYEYAKTKIETEYFNEFDVTTEFNGNVNKQTVIVRTYLVYLPGDGWKISEIEFVGELTGRVAG